MHIFRTLRKDLPHRAAGAEGWAVVIQMQGALKAMVLRRREW